MRVFAVARNTFRESIRDRVVHVVLVFAAILIVGSRILSPLALGEGDKITKDLGLSLMSLFGVLVVIFVGSSLVHKEIDRRTVYILLSKPVRRFEFLFGKFVGMAATLAAVTALMLAVLLALLAATGGGPVGGIVLAACLVGVELVVMAAVALLFSTFTTPALSAVFTLALYVAGRLSGDLLDFARAMPNAAHRLLAETMYAVLPNLEVLNVRAEVVHGVAIAPARVALAVSYALLYTAGVLAIASLVLSRRDFR